MKKSEKEKKLKAEILRDRKTAKNAMLYRENANRIEASFFRTTIERPE